MTYQPWPLMGFDTETTGVATDHDRVVTAALVRRDAAGHVNQQTWLINPGVEIPTAASSVHGITTEYAAAHGVDPAQGLEEIAAVLAAGLNQGLPVLAFNAGFDLRILEAELQRHGLATLAERLGREVSPVIDPLVIDRGVDRYRRGKRKLVDLMAQYGVAESDNLHDAAEDVRAAMAVFDAIASAYPQVANMDLAVLHAWQAKQHRDWAVNLNQWLASKGRTADVELDWP